MQPTKLYPGYAHDCVDVNFYNVNMLLLNQYKLYSPTEMKWRMFPIHLCLAVPSGFSDIVRKLQKLIENLSKSKIDQHFLVGYRRKHQMWCTYQMDRITTSYCTWRHMNVLHCRPSQLQIILQILDKTSHVCTHLFVTFMQRSSFPIFWD